MPRFALTPLTAPMQLTSEEYQLFMGMFNTLHMPARSVSLKSFSLNTQVNIECGAVGATVKFADCGEVCFRCKDQDTFDKFQAMATRLVAFPEHNTFFLRLENEEQGAFLLGCKFDNVCEYKEELEFKFDLRVLVGGILPNNDCATSFYVDLIG